MTEQPSDITLALSGGGLRAALFHLGVIRYLRDSGNLARVTRVFAISGGSVFAAHLALNWKKFSAGGSDEDFQAAAESFVDFCQSDLRGKLVRQQLLYFLTLAFLTVVPPSVLALDGPAFISPLLFTALFVALMGIAVFVFWSYIEWTATGFIKRALRTVVVLLLIAVPLCVMWGGVPTPITGWNFLSVWLLLVAFFAIAFCDYFSLTKYLLREYDRFYRVDNAVAKLHHLASGDGVPVTYLLATSYTTGQMVWFSHDGTTLCRESAPPIQSDHNNLPLSYGVASSSAFPPAFPPVKVTARVLALDVSELTHPEYLGDGGVYDNLGIAASQLPALKDGVGELLISSAEQRFDLHINKGFYLLPSRAARASDILMSRVSRMTRDQTLGDQNRLVALAEDLSANWLDVAMQQVVRNLRTDLDRFSAPEVQLLYFYGYGAAVKAFGGNETRPTSLQTTSNGIPIASNGKFWLPIKKDGAEMRNASVQTLERGTTLRLGVWNWRDWKSYALLFVFIITVIYSYPSLAFYKSTKRIPADLQFHLENYNDFEWSSLPSNSGLTSTVEKILHGPPASTLTINSCEEGAIKHRAIGLSSQFGLANSAHPTSDFGLIVTFDPSLVDRFRCSAYLVHAGNAGIEQLKPLATNDATDYRFLVPASDTEKKIAIIISFCTKGEDEPNLKSAFKFSQVPLATNGG